MNKLLLPVVLAVLLSSPSIGAADGVQCALDVYQLNEDGADVRLLADTTVFAGETTTSGFLLTMSTEFQVSRIDSTGIEFLAHVVTLGPPARTYSRNVTIEYGLPARIDDIIGKDDNRYALVITPLSRVEVDTADCPFDHRGKGVFAIQPSANLDIHYVPGSFGEFYWSAVKGLFETDYRAFQKQFNLNLPGKYSIYLCPCLTPTVIWDTRFGQAIDPTRSVGFAIYTNQANSADPFVINHLAVLRSFGYAPPFLSEGWAGYTSFGLYDMKRYLGDGTALPLDSLLDTYRYLKTDANLADRSAATFVKYLIDTYGVDKFRLLYTAADDLNLRQQLSKVYEMSVDDLDRGWRQFVDTSQIRFVDFARQSERAEAMNSFGNMAAYARSMQDVSPGRIDSMFSLSVLKRALFFEGDYYGAQDAAARHLQLDRTDSRNWMALAGYRMMNGLYPEARQDLLNGLAVDSSDQMSKFNLALNYLYTGDTATAESLFVEIVNNTADNSAQALSRLYLGEIIRHDGSPNDSARAMTYFSEALQAYGNQLQANPGNANAYLWAGVASLGFGDTDNAFTALQTSLFLETRPFYVGLTNLWLGKLTDVLGDHTAARDYYGAVLAGASADYHQAEARRYIEHPYTQ